MHMWINECAYEIYEDYERFILGDDAEDYASTDKYLFAIKAFPMLHDIVMLHTDESNYGGTFRVLLTNEQEDFMRNVSLNAFIITKILFSCIEFLILHIQ